MADITPARKLFDLLVSRDFDPEMLDSSGKPISDPAKTEIYSIDFRARSGKDYGTVVIMLGDDNALEVYCSDNVGRTMEGDDKNDWFAFLEQLKNFAVRNFMTFGIKNLNRLRYSMQGQAAIKEGLFESWTGNRTTSWNGAATEARLMIRHKKNISEGDARFRYIESLFIETADSERYKLPFKSLTGGRAMLEHVRQGGRPYDGRGNHIAEMVTELAVLSRFRRANQGQIFEGDTQQLLEQVQEYQSNLQRSLKGLGTQTGYTTYFESWSPAEISEQDVVIESLKNLFVKQSIDTRIVSALPLLAKIQQQGTEMKEANIFEAWVDRLAEGTWSLPDTPEKRDQLVELLSQDLPVGADATNATEQLYDLVGDDELFDQLEELADQDANADARQVIYDRLQELSDWPEVRQVLDQLQIDDTADMDPPEATDPEPMNESVLTDSTGSTFQHILSTFKRDVNDFKENGELSTHLYDALYDYYSDDMPYGTQKARSGDPYEWVADRFGADLGIDGYGGNSPGVSDEDYSMERESAGDYADEYQDSLAGMLKIAGVPAKQRPAPEYDHADMEEGLVGAALGGAAGALVGGPVGAVRGAMAGNTIGNAIGGDDEATDEGILGTLGGGAVGTMLGGPIGGIVGAGLGQAATSGGSSIIEQDEEQLDEFFPLVGMALGSAGSALGGALAADTAIGSTVGSLAGRAAGMVAANAISSDDAPTDDATVEGWKGQLAGGTAGTLAGGAIGAVGGPIGAAVGGAVGGTAGQMIGDKLGGPDEEDELDNMRKNAGIHEDEQLNEFIGPAIAAGARLLMPLLSRVGPALGRMASTAGKAGVQAAGKGAQAAGQAAGQVARAGTEIAAKNAIPIGIGAGAYQAITDIADSMVGGVGQVYRDIGLAADAITKAVGSAIDEKTIVELAGAAVKYAIPIGILLAVLYGGKKLIDKALAEGLTDDGSAGAAPGNRLTKDSTTNEGPIGSLIGNAIGKKLGTAAGVVGSNAAKKLGVDVGKMALARAGRAGGQALGQQLGDVAGTAIGNKIQGKLQGQYGHPGQLKDVSKDTSFLDRLKELSGMKK